MYKGPKAFQRHFAEWRHAHGMRCLGIPNTAHFANVTQIEDALACKQRVCFHYFFLGIVILVFSVGKTESTKTE